MVQASVSAFAELGRVWRSLTLPTFAEPIAVTEPEVLRDLLRLLEPETGDLQRLFEVTLDDSDTFRGKAEQRISLGRSQTYQFTISPDQMVYKLVDPDAAAEFADSDEGWVAIADFAAKAGKKLNCKPGNVQCGGKCQSGKLNCYANMTPAQKKAAQAVAGKARTKAAAAPSTPAPPPAVAPPTTPIASPVRTNQTELDKSRADLVNRFGQKLVEDAEKNVQRILDDSDVFIRVGSSGTLEQILGDRFKTAHELGRTDHQIPYLKDDYLTARARVEARTLGYAEKGTADDERPIYAYMGGKDMSGNSHAQVAQAYGSIAVKLKPEVKDRTTFTGADSFKSGIASEVKNDGTPPPPNAASMVSTTRHGYDRDKLPSHYPGYYADKSQDSGMLRGAARARDIDDLVPKLAPTGNAYMEAQVHGKVKPTDIAEIHFTPRGVSDRPTPAVAQFARDNGVDLYVNGRKLSRQEIDQIATPPADKRSQQVRDLADALDKGDIGKVVQLADDLGKSAQNVNLNPGERDRTLKHLRAEAGYDGLPKVGSAQDVTDTWKQGGVLMVRGDQDTGSVTGRQILNQFQTGDFHTGNGIYGNGTYVGHAGKFVNGKYVGYDSRTEAADAKRAVNDVSKHDYINARTTITRMALTPDANVVKQSDLMNQRSLLRSQIDTWYAAERNRATAGAKVFTRSDVSRYNQRLSAAKGDYDVANLQVSVGKKRTINGGASSRTDQDWEIPNTQGGQPLKFKVVHSTSNSSISSLSSYRLIDDQGQTIATVQQSKTNRKPTRQTIQALRDAAIQKQVLDSLGMQQPPVAGAVNDPVAQRRLNDLDDRVKRVRETLGVDNDLVGGSVERLAIIRGVDAIALDQSYEPNTFMNLLNRSKVVVQQDPLSWRQAQRTGAL